MGAALLLLAPSGMASRVGRIGGGTSLGLVRVPTPSARAARRVLMGWIARRSGRVPFPPAQAGGALCPRARGGSARTNNCAGTYQPNYTTICILGNFSFYPGARRAPGKLHKMWGLILYIFGGGQALMSICAGTPQQAGGASCPRARRVGTQQRASRAASERASGARLVAPQRGA